MLIRIDDRKNRCARRELRFGGLGSLINLGDLSLPRLHRLLRRNPMPKCSDSSSVKTPTAETRLAAQSSTNGCNVILVMEAARRPDAKAACSVRTWRVLRDGWL